MGGAVQYGNDNMPNVWEFCYLGMWMNRTMSMSFASWRMCGSMLAAWRQVLPVAIGHGVRDSVAQASLLDELGLQPLPIIWLKACVKPAVSASRGNPLLWEAMGANVELSKDCHKAYVTL
jgi:hypothetical protein